MLGDLTAETLHGLKEEKTLLAEWTVVSNACVHSTIM